MSNASQIRQTRCCVVGGGPAGMMLGLQLARRGVDVIVLEKHGDFLRDFRGDTVHPATLEILAESGLKARFDALPQHRAEQIEILLADGVHAFGDFRRLKPFPYLALVPQWDLLDLLRQAAQSYPNFRLLIRTEACDLIPGPPGTDRICGVIADTPEGRINIRADLVVGCDGRHSRLRQVAGFKPRDLGAPMDVLWFRLPRKHDHPQGTYGVPGKGSLLVLLNRNDYWQVALVIPKGGAARWQARPIQDLHTQIAQRVAFLATSVDALDSWDQVKLLEVRVDRLPRWHKPGLLLIGDAAHAMSPIGGVGINLAIQDAVATANILGPCLLAPGLPDEALLAAVQRRRLRPTRIIQTIQVFLQRRLIAKVLDMRDDGQPLALPSAIKWLLRWHLIRSIPAYVFGVVRIPMIVTTDSGDRDHPVPDGGFSLIPVS